MILFPTLHKSLFLRQSWVQYSLSIAVLINFALWVWVYRSVEPSVTPIPIHVTAYFGIDFTAPFWWYYFFPGGGLLVIILHGIIARFIHRDESLLAKLVLVSAVLFNAAFIGIVYFLTSYLA